MAGEEATVHGFVAPGFEAVADAMRRNFAKNHEVGAACCVHLRGEKVVDIWAGTKDPQTGSPWEEDTLAIVFSSTKGVTAIVQNLLLQRGQLDLAAPIARYWPEFAAAGKRDIPVEQILAHRAGIPIVDSEPTLEQVLAWDPIIEAIARQRPAWEPGEKHGYHVRTFGWVNGEIVRRISGRSFGRFLADEITGPLDANFFVGLPEEKEACVARLIPPPEPEDPRTRAAIEKFMGPATVLGRALRGPSDLFHYDDMWNTRALHAAEMPSSNGITSARGLSRIYASCVGEIGGARTLSDESVRRAIRVRSRGPDAVLQVPSVFGLGFARGEFLNPEAGQDAFGHPGAGGSLGFADPANGLAFAYVMNRMQTGVTGDPRASRLVRATYRCLS